MPVACQPVLKIPSHKELFQLSIIENLVITNQFAMEYSYFGHSLESLLNSNSNIAGQTLSLSCGARGGEGEGRGCASS